MIALTQQQKDAYEFIRKRIEARGIAPSYAEIRNYLGLKSSSGVHRIVRALEERGRIRTLHGRARAIEIINEPRKVELKSEFIGPMGQYAHKHSISIDTAVNEAVRCFLGDAA